MDGDMTNLQSIEEPALDNNEIAIKYCIRALRAYRKNVKELLASRYADGECDMVSLSVFASRIESIEEGSFE